MKQPLESLKNKIIDRDALKTLVSKIKQEQKSIIFSNGCFDLVHRGHVEYLAQASNLADVFILGLNTDNSIRRLKGSQRPLQDEYARAILMSGFSFIDYVVLFDEDTPYELISEIIPDILVKGNDYKAEEVVGYDIVTQNGGAVKTIPLVEGYSTSNIVEKIKKF